MLPKDHGHGEFFRGGFEREFFPHFVKSFEDCLGVLGVQGLEVHAQELQLGVQLAAAAVLLHQVRRDLREGPDFALQRRETSLHGFHCSKKQNTAWEEIIGGL